MVCFITSGGGRGPVSFGAASYVVYVIVIANCPEKIIYFFIFKKHSIILVNKKISAGLSFSRSEAAAPPITFNLNLSQVARQCGPGGV